MEGEQVARYSGDLTYCYAGNCSRLLCWWEACLLELRGESRLLLEVYLLLLLLEVCLLLLLLRSTLLL